MKKGGQKRKTKTRHKNKQIICHKSTYIHVGTPCRTPSTSWLLYVISVIMSRATIILLQRLFFHRVQAAMVSDRYLYGRFCRLRHLRDGFSFIRFVDLIFLSCNVGAIICFVKFFMLFFNYHALV